MEMSLKNRFIIYVCILMIPVCLLFSCSKPKQGKLSISNQEFSLRKDGTVWVIDAKGKVKNIGEVDVKNVVITGFCRSCGEVVTSKVWYVATYEKEPKQKDTIGYLAVGAEEEFHFQEVAYYYDQSGTPPSALPDRLECEIISFESAKK